MKTVLVALLLVLLCTSQVQSLRCFTCDGGPRCKTITECPSTSNFCRTEATADTFSRTCEDICTEAVGVTCCTEDLCG